MALGRVEWEESNYLDHYTDIVTVNEHRIWLSFLTIGEKAETVDDKFLAIDQRK